MTNKNPLTELKNVEDCACFNIRAAARTLTRAYDDALKPVGLKVTQFTILAAINKIDEAVPIGTLAKALSMDRTTLTRNLGPLEKQGLVEVLPEGYRRSRGMVLTEKGRKTLEAAAPLWRRAQETTVGRIGSERWTSLQQDMVALVG
ncbi:MarR family winged helix-turn-helix transcriptional regulator [Kiloniella sp.]|uniref:MarR family winged helix-turn-helix transcriptional regulator n=1 Tax=Kiloniella sp. TaxID=1938587 RepID=UPI003B028BD6